jgi:uncharacterized protein YcnI
MKRWILAAALAVIPLVASAHVTIWPRQSATKAYEKYVVRVPTEGKVSTQSVELRVPPGVQIVSMGAANGFTYELKRTGDRVSAIVWTMNIAPGEFAEFAFMARNPGETGSVRWEAIQRFVDGTSTEWTGATGTKTPASVTEIVAGPSGHAH